MLLYIFVCGYSVYACCLLCVVCSCLFVLSFPILVLCFRLTTCARFFFDVRLFCFVVSGGLNISPIALIELFYSSQSYFIVRLVFVCFV